MALSDRIGPLCDLLLGAAYAPGNDEATAPERGASIAPVLDDQTLSRAASTVDDIELVQGRAATVLALAAISGGNLKNVGHYGYGSGSSAPLPPHRAATAWLIGSRAEKREPSVET